MSYSFYLAVSDQNYEVFNNKNVGWSAYVSNKSISSSIASIIHWLDINLNINSLFKLSKTWVSNIKMLIASLTYTVYSNPINVDESSISMLKNNWSINFHNFHLI